MSENSNIIDVTETEFNDQVIEASESKLIVVDFWAPWCAPCKALTPTLEELAIELSDEVSIHKVNIDENMEIATQQRVQSIPTLVIFRKGEEVNRVVGNKSKEELTGIFQG